MKKCNTQIMKEIKKLQEEKIKLLEKDRTTQYVTYATEEELLDVSYDYEKMSNNLDWYDNEIRRLKVLLANSNNTTIVEGFDMNLNEALIYLAQLKLKEKRLNNMSNREQFYRGHCSIFGKSTDCVEYTKALYDVEKASNDLKEIKDTIIALQMAIDRTNLSNMIEC